MTVSKNLNDVSKFIVPLLDDNLTLEDISEESGFVNAFSTDKNRPYLEDKVFLLYKSTTNTVESLTRFRKFNSLDTIYNTRFITIKGEHYTVYAFNRVAYRKDIKNLLTGNSLVSLQAKLEISNFWKTLPTDDLNLRLFLPHYRFAENIEATVPEEDFYPYEQKKESLTTILVTRLFSFRLN